MQMLQKVYEKYTFKIAVLVTIMLLSLVVVVGLTSQRPVPAWWFAFVPVLLSLLKL